MASETALEADPRTDEAGPGGESPCLDAGLLREVFSNSGFERPGDASRALDHFARSCRHCWSRLEELADDDSVVVDLGALSRAATRDVREPPVALVLGRLVALRRKTGEEATLAPMNRYLLCNPRWGRGFSFRWLLVEEARLLALGSASRRPERWPAVAAALAGHAPGAAELELLIRAYEGDDLRIAGRRQEAETCFTDVLNGLELCRPLIRATLHEVLADHERGRHRPPRSLAHLRDAEALFASERIPGRLAEIRTRIALSHLLQGQHDEAFTAFSEALEMIPEGTDPRLRLDILIHMAAIKAHGRDLEGARRCLSQAEPFFEHFASELILVQRDWLWGLVYLADDDAEAADRLKKALAGFRDLDEPLAEAQVLVNLSQFYLRVEDQAGLDWALSELASTLNRPEIRLHVLDEVESVFRQVRERGGEVPELRELHGYDDSIN